MKPVRTRFAPSPTGYLHVGGVRTALFAWLIAKQSNGEFILRIEDTDKVREVPGSVEHIKDSLAWIGIHSDEEPYKQSDRLDIYKNWAKKLLETGRAYADPYSPEEVQVFRDDAKAKKQPFLFRNHRPEKPPEWDGTQPLRFKSEPKEYHWTDAVMGELSAGPEVIDDFILLKSDGYPTYNFAHIVDDNEMAVTHVIRSQEFLASVPKYLNLYEALSITPPVLATLPFVMSPGGNKKLSKRDGAKDILDYAKDGYLPEAMLNFLATLGWNDGTEQEIFTVDELIKKFNLGRVHTGGAHFDEQRLEWMNGQWIREKIGLDELYKRSKGFWPETANKYDDDYKKQVLAIVRERLKYFAELPELTAFFFEDLPVDATLITGHKQLKKLSTKELGNLLGQARKTLGESDFSVNDLTKRLNDLLDSTGQKPVVLFSLIRIATTQAAASPGLADTLAVLGKERSLRRIDTQVGALDP